MPWPEGGRHYRGGEQEKCAKHVSQPGGRPAEQVYQRQRGHHAGAERWVDAGPASHASSVVMMCKKNCKRWQWRGVLLPACLCPYVDVCKQTAFLIICFRFRSLGLKKKCLNGKIGRGCSVGAFVLIVFVPRCFALSYVIHDVAHEINKNNCISVVFPCMLAYEMGIIWQLFCV